LVRTKIIATVGPASRKLPVLRQMMRAGVDVLRLNFSHGLAVEHQYTVDILRRLNRDNRRRIKILPDLEGSRIRIGRLKGAGIALEKKQVVYLVKEDKRRDAAYIPFDYAGPLEHILPGSWVYIDDGTIALMVTSSTPRYLKLEVVVPGVVREHKGVNIPDVALTFKGLTAKDKADIRFGIKNKVNYIAQSFVRDKEDMLALKDAFKGSGHTPQFIAKIENRQGIKNIDSILYACDGIMVARGDMGVSLPIYEIPVMQKFIIKKCNQRKKFVITATQMLESMTEHLRPTRAEATDVANAILDGTDYLMLSGETAMGKYPVECVRMMNQIARYTEEAVRNKVFLG
jgi:pyruvate kinase